MKITSLVDNTSHAGLPVEHGLSLHIALDNRQNILFDMGQGSLFASNAATLGIDIASVDAAIISHGHYDHGGGLKTFLEKNSLAMVYINTHAFEPHYSLRATGLTYIGLDCDLKTNKRLILCNNETQIIDNGIILFSGVNDNCLYPTGNKLLYGPEKDINDDFCHEQSLIITENDKTVLFAGCAHTGILNIMQKAEKSTNRTITHVFAGMHLVKSGLSNNSESAFIHALSLKLLNHQGCRYYTMHCTGLPQYELLKKNMNDAIGYMSCGDTVII